MSDRSILVLDCVELHRPGVAQTVASRMWLYACLPIIVAAVGGVWTSLLPPSPKVVSAVQHFAAGVIFYAAAGEVLPDPAARPLAPSPSPCYQPEGPPFMNERRPGCRSIATKPVFEPAFGNVFKWRRANSDASVIQAALAEGRGERTAVGWRVVATAASS